MMKVFAGSRWIYTMESVSRYKIDDFGLNA